jgi:hypothetical protein
MFGADEPAFQALRYKMESEWIHAMMHLLDLDRVSLPVIWDADFLYGPKTELGEDTYVLCEINVSAAFPSRSRRQRKSRNPLRPVCYPPGSPEPR